jgi:hypothetical protein
MWERRQVLPNEDKDLMKPALTEEKQKALDDAKKKVRVRYGENREVMVFDEFNIHPEKESVIKIIDWDNIYPLTKYFYL